MLKLIFKNLKKNDYIMLSIMIILIAGSVYLELLLPSFMQEITLLLTTGNPTTTDIMIIGSKMLSCALGAGIISVATGFLSARISADLSYYLRDKVFSKVQSFSLAEIKHFSSASLITRTTNDVSQIQGFLSLGIVIIFRAPIMAIWAISIIATKNIRWTLATTIAVVLIVLIILTIIFICLPKFKKVQDLTDDLNRVSRENLTGLRVVRAFNAEKFEDKKCEIANENLTKTHLFIGRNMGALMPSLNVVMHILTLIIYAIAIGLMMDANGADSRALIFADMTVFTSYSMQIIMSFMMLILIFIMLPRALVSARRISEVLNTDSSIVNGKLNVSQNNSGSIEFKNVSFKYPDAEEYILKDISLDIKPGETIAFIGSTGSGKSTLINLIPRLYDVTDGEVLVDGVNVKDYDLHNLNNKIGYISQRAVIFNDTIKNNVTYGDAGKEIKDSEVDDAIKCAEAYEFVDKLDGKTNYMIAQNGTNISGGQKQRLNIARALAKNPEILIFDDAFSALDMKTDRKLRKNLESKYKNTTVIIVAQRIGTIKNADKIIVLDEGLIVGMGTHENLLKSCKTYKEIALSQLSKEEL